MRHSTFALFVTLAALSGLTRAATAADVAAGRRVAINICSACHVVAADQPYPPVLHQPGPSFATIANRPSAGEASIRAFLSTTHTSIQNQAGMPNPQLTDDQTNDVVAYILGLRKQQK